MQPKYLYQIFIRPNKKKKMCVFKVTLTYLIFLWNLAFIFYVLFKKKKSLLG